MSTSLQPVPETVNLHIWPRCNLRCTYCYGRFPERPPTLSAGEWCRIVDRLRAVGVQRVNFSGGEPTLYPGLEPVALHAKKIGLRVSVITNGARVTDAFLSTLDLMGLSIDSADDQVLPSGLVAVLVIRLVDVHRRGARVQAAA